MARRPTVVNIHPMTYKIKAVDIPLGGKKNDEFTFGNTHFDRQEIDINPNQTPISAAETLIHEILHIWWFSCGLPDEGEENYVLALAPRIFAFIRDNPELITYIQEARNP